VARISDRLAELGIELPIIPKPLANYVPAKRVGNLVTTAGQVPVWGGREYKGRVGSALSVDEGREATRVCAINCLAALLTVIDSLDQVQQVVSVHGFVNSAPGFDGQAAAMSGASDLMVSVFGDAGRHTRTAVGVAGLPADYAASVYILAEVE
jgi:enamine deaminase RidA (YjgF/YER057c/UK114 family)